VSDPDAQFAPTRRHVLAWLEQYERAWRTPGTHAIDTLFTDDASYLTSPFDPPIVGSAKIAEMWEREREGPDEPFTMTSEIVAVEGDTAVARIEVQYADPPATHYRDLWVIRFDSSGRSRAFEEWPFWADRPRAASLAALRV
jgi:ketosteroid isomerase-like protein